MRPALVQLIEALLPTQEIRAIAAKPNLRQLCVDVRRAANVLPVGVERRLVLEEVLVAFSKMLRSPGYRDVTPAAADAFRNEHGISKAVA